MTQKSFKEQKTHTSIFSLRTILKKVSGSLVGYLQRRSRLSVDSTPMCRVLGLDAIAKQSTLSVRDWETKWKRKIAEETEYIETRFTESVAEWVSYTLCVTPRSCSFWKYRCFFFSFFWVSLLFFYGLIKLIKKYSLLS